MKIRKKKAVKKRAAKKPAVKTKKDVMEELKHPDTGERIVPHQLRGFYFNTK